MKTFEERYTAWIDGALDSPAQAGFEQELARRSAAGEARADKATAARLRRLLTTHLQAPALTNPDFFNHQLLGRIEADRAADRRRAEARARRAPLFGWSFAKLAGVGTAGVFVAAALYYGLGPERQVAPGHLAKNAPTEQRAVEQDKTPAADALPVPGPGRSRNDGQLAQNTAKPPVLLPNTDIQGVQVAEPSAQTTTATPLHYQAPNVNVLWINGLDYLPNVPGETPPAPPAVPAASANP